MVQCHSIFKKLRNFRHKPSLHSVPAHAMHGLGCQADVTHSWNLCIQHAANESHSFSATLQLHCLGSAFLDKSHCISQSLFFACVISAVRQIRYKKGPFHS